MQKGVDKVKKSVWIYMALVVGLLFAASSARAYDFGFGTGPAVAPDALPVGCFVPGVPAPGSGCPTTLVADTGPTPYAFGAISGTIEEIVLLDTTPNLVCPSGGCYDFEIEVLNNAGPDTVGRVTTTNYTGFAVDAGIDSIYGSIGLWPTSGGMVAPATVDRVTADTIGFNFSIPVGSSSDILEIETNATSYTTGLISVIDGGAANVTGFAPGVPEPATLSVLGIGLLSLLGLRKKNA